MFAPVLRELMHPVRAQIIEELKMSDGLPVAEIARRMEMSYMGIKQHCVKLEKLGFVKDWRVPRSEAGRPEKLYRLTERCEPLFPRGGPQLTLGVLQSMADTMGQSAPEKVLFGYFRNLRQSWIADVQKGKSLVEKATRLTALRDELGIFSRCQFDRENGFRIEEYHHSLRDIFEEYPSAEMMELRMIEELIGTKVNRSERETSRGTKVVILEVRTMGV